MEAEFLSEQSYLFLCRELQPHLERSDAVRIPLQLDQRVANCLWRLGINVEYRTISHLFGLGILMCVRNDNNVKFVHKLVTAC